MEGQTSLERERGEVKQMKINAPWKYEKGYEGSGPFDRMTIFDANDNVIAKLDRMGSIYPESSEDAFRLMAAAPELLESVQFFLSWFNKEQDSSPEILFELVEKAENAIAKARNTK